jgi:hypothetical protein
MTDILYSNARMFNNEFSITEFIKSSFVKNINHNPPAVFDSQYGLFNVSAVTANATFYTKAFESFEQQLSVTFYKIVNVDPAEILSSFLRIVNDLSKLIPSEISTQFTSTNSFVIKSSTAHGNIYFELFFDESTGLLEEVALNIFLDKELQFSNTGSLESMLFELQEYSGSEEIDYFSFVNQTKAYELPGTDFATAELEMY